uniref:CCHC-type domain-containing protein n=1 Tax=Beta vulgaris subsp. vulgaris TaxID=3555 RepID=F4NCJ5_BETVV|nr:hypothetical protein [Beta vulgaris subsp. vulgaris]
MAEEISEFVSQLRIDDEEDAVLDIESINPNNDNNVALLLLGRLLTVRSYNVEAFKRTITTVWAPKHGLVIRVLKPNLFAFQFFHWRDMMKVLDGRPWCFDNTLILLKEAEGDEQPDQVSLNHSPFWIRLKNLSLNHRSNDVVKALIGNMGEILDIEEDVLGFGRYRRVKVMLDVSKPLRRYRKIRDKRGRELQIDFAYERLPFFCLACGVMGHSEKDCQVVLEEDKCEKLGWHLGLKATPRKGRSKEVEEEVKFRNCKKVLFNEGNRGVHGESETTGQALIKSPDLHGKVLSADQSLPKHGTAENTQELGDPVFDLVGEINVEDGLHAPSAKYNKAAFNIDVQVNPCNNEGKGANLKGQSGDGFVFSSSKETSEGKARAWKRLARGKMEDKGVPQQMDMDSLEKFLKRATDQCDMVNDSHDGATKRFKLSPSCEVNPIFSAEIGATQSRQSL